MDSCRTKNEEDAATTTNNHDGLALCASVRIGSSVSGLMVGVWMVS